jgi:hypothetical protein
VAPCFWNDTHYTGWTTYFIHPGIFFYRKLYNGGNCSTIWQNKTHFYAILTTNLYDNSQTKVPYGLLWYYLHRSYSKSCCHLSNHSYNISCWWCMTYVVHSLFLVGFVLLDLVCLFVLFLLAIVLSVSVFDIPILITPWNLQTFLRYARSMLSSLQVQPN